MTSRALAAAAHISLNTACTWLRQRETGALERRQRYQFCNIALIAFLITCLRPRTAPRARPKGMHRQRWIRPKLRPRHRRASRSCLRCRSSARPPATSCSGAGARAPGSVRRAAGSSHAERVIRDETSCRALTRLPSSRNREGRVGVSANVAHACSTRACEPALDLAGPARRCRRVGLLAVCHTCSRAARGGCGRVRVVKQSKRHQPIWHGHAKHPWKCTTDQGVPEQHQTNVMKTAPMLSLLQ